MKELKEESQKLLVQNQLHESLRLINDYLLIKSDDPEGYLLRAKISCKMQKWGDAMNDYSSVLDLDPENQEAKSGLEMAQNILSYFTPDMFNP